MNYRPEIDGLRALAVLPVIFFHAGFDTFRGGFIGVDVFFVISGYLITSIILHEIDKGRFSLIGFYERRARRILPALFFMIFACTPIAWHVLQANDFKDYSLGLIAVSTFWSNILFWMQSGYFAADAELNPLLHTWSLSVEEQYYVLYPAFLMLMWRFARKFILPSLVVLFVLSLLLAHWGAFRFPGATFFLLPTRGWELLIGVFAAFYLHRKPDITRRRKLGSLGLVGLLLIAAATYLFDEGTPFPSLYALVPTIGVLLIIIFAVDGTLANKILKTKILVGIGLISYSAYLWHQPLLAFAKYQSITEPSKTLMMSLCLVAFPIAYFSYRFVEQPFRAKEIFDRIAIFKLGGFVSFCFVIAGGLGYSLDGVRSRPAVQRFAILDYEPDNRELRERTWDLLRRVSNDSDYTFIGNASDTVSWFDMTDARKRMLIIGDSHSKDLFNVLWHSKHVKENSQLARFGVQFRNISERLYAAPNYINANIVIIVGRYYEQDLARLEGVVNRFLQDGKKVVLVKRIFEFEGYKHLTRADQIIRGAIASDTVNTDRLRHVANSEYFDRYSERRGESIIEVANKAIDDISAKETAVTILDRMDYVCDYGSQECFTLDDRLNKFFFDYGHHTVAGSKYFAKRVDEIAWLSDVIGE